MQDLIINAINQFGYLGIVLLIAIENIFPPIPSEVILTFGGFMTTYSNLTVFLVIAFATIGSILGAIILYGIGRLLNRQRLERLLDSKIGKLLHFKKEDVFNSEKWFMKHGNIAVFFCRFIPIVRSLISIPAGMTKMRFNIFILLTLAGTVIWNTVLVCLGAAFGSSWEEIVKFFNTYSEITLITICIVFILAIILFYKKRIANKSK